MEPELIIQVSPFSELSPADQEAIHQVDRAAFAPEENQEPDPYVWANSEYMVTGRLNGQIVSIVGLLVREARLGDQPVRMGGVGGVATLPEYRRKGYSSALLIEARRYLHEILQVDFGLLVCDQAKIPFYGRAGWLVSPNRMEFDQPTGKVGWLGVTMVLPCRMAALPPGVIDLCGLPF